MITDNRQRFFPGWTAVQRHVKINYDLENSPLQIRTDSEVESNERLAVLLYNAQEEYGGAIYVHFRSPPQYLVESCNSSHQTSNFHTALPTETDKIWRLTLTRTTDIRLIIHCNNKEVLNVLISGTTCSIDGWHKWWSRDVEKIMFSSYDTASNYYRPGF